MKTICPISSNKNFDAANFGPLTKLNEYELHLAPGVIIPGKVFGGSALKATGGEFSFQVFAPGQETGFLHTHKNHEELYFFLSGNGQFQVDGEIFDVTEGSAVRVAPDGERSVRNNGDTPLVMLCVQYRGNTFTAEAATDGVILQKEVNW